LVKVAGTGGGGRLVTVTAAGRAVAAAKPLPAGETPMSGPAVVLDPSGTIELRQPSPLRVWSLSAFADVERLDRVAIYRLTEDSIDRALTSGFDVRQIQSFLAAQSGTEVPPEVEERLAAWTRGLRRVRLRRAVIATPDDPGLVDELREIAHAHDMTTGELGESLLIALPALEGETGDAGLPAMLRDAGFTPLWDTRDLGSRPPSRTASQEQRSSERGTRKDESPG
jgi:hypothetical protein